jgi:ATP-dependent exoDNAse (exonuclease V) alpha subunit
VIAEELKDTSFEECVMTVHASQGREWDTVLLSVVDTTNKWFTDSVNKMSRGKQVINTAVSRARKNLIVVCDARYWEKMAYQLIGQLLREAKSI